MIKLTTYVRVVIIECRVSSMVGVLTSNGGGAISLALMKFNINLITGCEMKTGIGLSPHLVMSDVLLQKEMAVSREMTSSQAKSRLSSYPVNQNLEHTLTMNVIITMDVS